jgi:hypothetical protein
MPDFHSIGPRHYFQFLKFPVQWEKRLWVRGWSQEIEEPFRFSAPVIVRLPFHRAVAFGRWTGTRDEEEALGLAIQRRDLTDADFLEGKGWTPPAYEAGEADSVYLDA